MLTQALAMLPQMLQNVNFLKAKAFSLYKNKLFGQLNGLTDGLHGAHIHEFGELGDGCKAAGGHFDPNQTEDETGLYVGDLGSQKSLNGVAFVRLHKPEVKLSGPEDFSVLNRAIVVHQDPTGGARVMCCLIKGP